MAKKIVKKRKIKLLNLFIVLVILLGLFFACYYIVKLPIKNIIIRKNNYLSDDYIIELAEIKDYPNFLLTSKSSIKKKLEKSEFIDSVKINKKLGNILEITVIEKKIIFFDLNKNNYIFDDGSELKEYNGVVRVPRLINYVPDTKYEKFISVMGLIKENTISKISDIEYKPNDYDKDRFLLYMDDGNMVYLTLTKFKMINKYSDVLSQLENHKGILYLDNGNHFKIME